MGVRFTIRSRRIIESPDVTCKNRPDEPALPGSTPPRLGPAGPIMICFLLEFACRHSNSSVNNHSEREQSTGSEPECHFYELEATGSRFAISLAGKPPQEGKRRDCRPSRNYLSATTHQREGLGSSRPSKAGQARTQPLQSGVEAPTAGSYAE